jgi:hypothetical protein
MGGSLQRFPFGDGEALMKRRFGIVTLASVLLLTVFTLAVDVQTDYDHGVDFSKYKTYSWLKVETPDTIWDSRVRVAIKAELTKKGLSEVPSDGDIDVVAVATTRERPTLETFYNDLGGWYWQGFGEATTTVHSYREGTLIVDLLDASTKKLIWRGSATDTLSEKAEKNTQKLEKAVDKMFSQFPPKTS